MSIAYEIVRDDEVVLFFVANSYIELEDNILTILRATNIDNSYEVFTLNDKLERVGRRKKYKKGVDDKKIKKYIQDLKLVGDKFSNIILHGKTNNGLFDIFNEEE